MTFFDCHDFNRALENLEISIRCDECGAECELGEDVSADDAAHCLTCGADALCSFSPEASDYFYFTNWEDDDDDEPFRQWPPEPWRLLE